MVHRYCTSKNYNSRFFIINRYKRLLHNVPTYIYVLRRVNDNKEFEIPENQLKDFSNEWI